MPKPPEQLSFGFENPTVEELRDKRLRAMRSPSERYKGSKKITRQQKWSTIPSDRQGEILNTLANKGVTTEGAEQRLQGSVNRARKRARDNNWSTPQGEKYYSHENPSRFEDDAKDLGVPYEVIAAANAVTSPGVELHTARGFQLNREEAISAVRHAVSGKPGYPEPVANARRPNINKAVDITRQWMQNKTHPLDAKDEKGRYLLSGPKVEDYYSGHVGRPAVTTDKWHARLLFGPSVKGDITPEEREKKKYLRDTYGKKSPEFRAFQPKAEAERLLETAGVHEWADRVTKNVAKKVHLSSPATQAVGWFQNKFESGQPASNELIAPFSRIAKVNPHTVQEPLPMFNKKDTRGLTVRSKTRETIVPKSWLETKQTKNSDAAITDKIKPLSTQRENISQSQFGFS